MPNATVEMREVSVTKRDGSRKTVRTALDVAGAVRILETMGGSEFARSLARDHHRWLHRGGLIGSRADWAIVVAQEEIDRRAQAAAAPEAGPAGERIADDFGALAAIFRRTRHGARLPRITLQTATGRPVVLAVSGPRSRVPGAINVTDGRRYPDNTWYGRIAPDGAWNPGRAADGGVTDLLRRFAADPASVASQYGRITGSCCFCQRELTDRRSIDVGYGPVCADNYGLPWGERSERVARPAPAAEEADLCVYGR
jgi:hypothetical protein